MKHGPDFLCIGAEKAGTTWLYDNIRHHHDIWLPPPPFKELHYFDDKTPNKNLLHLGRFNHGGLIRRYSPLVHSPNMETLRWTWRFNHHHNDSMHWYRSLFTKEGKLCGDITPSYSTMDARGVEYARKVVGSRCKIILILREPVSRTWSSVKMLYRYRNIDIRNCDTSEIVKEMQSPLMTLKSSYSTMIELWSTYFDEDMLHIFFFDDLVNDNHAFISNVCQFIGIDINGWSPPKIDQVTNQDKARIVIPDEVKLQMSTYYLAELETLSKLLGGHTTTWFNKAKDSARGRHRKNISEGNFSGSNLI